MLGLGNILTKGGAVLGFPNKYSFNFDGSNDYLDCGTSPLHTLSATTFTISCWIKIDNVSSDMNSSIGSLIADSPALDPTNGGFWLAYDDRDGTHSPVEGIAYNIKTSAGYQRGKSNNNVISSGVWHHIALVLDGQATLYIDGASSTNRTEDNSGTLSTQSNELTIGSDDTNTYNFNGLIDEVAIWDTALSADDVAKIASKPVDFSKASTYATDRTSNLKLWLRAGHKVLPENDTAIARQDFYTDFDGTDDYVVVGNNPTAPLSISFWFNSSSSATSNQAMYSTTGALEIWIGYNTAGFLRAHFGGSSYIQTPSGIITQNRWYHVTVTLNGTTGKIYIDGVNQTLTTSGTLSAPDVSVANIGRRVDSNGNLFIGKISNLALHQTALDAQTISQMAKSRFTPMRDNRFSVVDFDGSNDTIEVADDNSLDFTTALTVSAWVRKTGTGYSWIVHKKDGSGECFKLDISASFDSNGAIRARVYGSGSNKNLISATANYNDSQWHHIVFTYEGGIAMTIYVDGSRTAYSTSSIPSSMNTSSDSLFIGSSGGINYYFEGSMSSVATYNTVKSAEEIYAIYQQGITYDESSLSGLVGYWRMGDDTSKAYPTIADSSSNSNDGTITNGASDDIVQQMVAGYDLGAFESSSEELQLLVTDGDWTIGGSWVYDSSTGYYTNTYINGTETPLGNIIASPATTVGRVYKLSYTVVSTTGSPTLKFPNNMLGLSSSNIPYTVGETNVHYGVDDGSSENIGIRSNTGVGTIVLKDIKFEEVLQSELSDTYPAIIDVNEPVLGGEEISEPSFASSTGWTLGTGWSISSNTLSSDGSQSAVSNASASITTGAGYYRVVITVDSISSGTIRPNLESWGSYISTTGTSTQFFTLTGNNNLTIQASADFVGSISLASVKEVFGNVGKMTNQDSADLVYSSVLPDQSFLTGANSSYGFGSFDGTNDIVTASAINTDYKSFSVWVKPTTTVTTSSGGEPIGSFFTGNLGVIWIGAFASGDTNELISLYDGTRTAWENAGDASFPSNSWTHLALVWDGSKYQIYYNGQPQTTTSNAGSGHVSLQNNNSVFIGRGGANRTEFFDGDMTGVALWNKSLSASEVSAIYTAGRHTNLLDSYSDNLITYLAFGNSDATSGFEDTSSTIYDRSGSSNHGTVSGTTLQSPPNAEPNGYAKGDTNRSTTTP